MDAVVITEVTYLDHNEAGAGGISTRVVDLGLVVGDVEALDGGVGNAGESEEREELHCIEVVIVVVVVVVIVVVADCRAIDAGSRWKLAPLYTRSPWISRIWPCKRCSPIPRKPGPQTRFLKRRSVSILIIFGSAPRLNPQQPVRAPSCRSAPAWGYKLK